MYTQVQSPLRPAEGARSPKGGTTDSCELPSVGMESDSGLLQEQTALFIS